MVKLKILLDNGHTRSRVQSESFEEISSVSIWVGFTKSWNKLGQESHLAQGGL